MTEFVLRKIENQSQLISPYFSLNNTKVVKPWAYEQIFLYIR